MPMDPRMMAMQLQGMAPQQAGWSDRKDLTGLTPDQIEAIRQFLVGAYGTGQIPPKPAPTLGPLDLVTPRPPGVRLNQNQQMGPMMNPPPMRRLG